MEEQLLPFRDLQAQKPVAFCCRCGREIYGQEGQCLYCMRYTL